MRIKALFLSLNLVRQLGERDEQMKCESTNREELMMMRIKVQYNAWVDIVP